MSTKAKPSIFKYDYLGTDVASVKHSLANRLQYSTGKDAYTATDYDWYNVTAYVVRDRLIERWMETMRSYYREDAKRVYYLSVEFLIGRTLTNSLLNMGFHEECSAALQELGLKLEAIREQEPDAALGNGGLGRLAACFLDSMATQRLPGYGYGIRYEYGMFYQRIEHGYQVEHPDNWLRYGNPWEFPRAELLYQVKFNGRVVQFTDQDGRLRHHWTDTEEVMAMAYDTPIPGYATNTVNNMRLWAAKASRDFNLASFNEGNYIKAVEEKNESENLSKVLYPDDTTIMGQELRLKQQYFFVSASLQDILMRYSKTHDAFDELPDKVAIQLNDTHPAIAIPELMHILLDVHNYSWETAWDITVQTFSYTNHTLLPEALETWPASLLESILPRHLQIINEVNRRFVQAVVHRYPGDIELLRRISIVTDGPERRIRMAHLAIVGSHTVNGVSQIHTHLMKTTIFADFHKLFPDRIINITNGITPRRWLNQANPPLSRLISSRIRHGWVTELELLSKLAPFADDAGFREEFMNARLANKERLAGVIRQHLGIDVDPHSMYDVQVKRIHEYKRQLLNVLHIITLYNRMRTDPNAELVPRTFIFGGKAAPGYDMAKLIIKLINDVADIINNDPAVKGRIKVVFIQNYDVSTAADIIPAADLSEQISTAGTEASGTGNMKLALNGALTIGTLDGANIEMREAVGEDNIFTFGLTADEVMALRRDGYKPLEHYNGNAELKQVIDMIGRGYFCHDACDRYQPLVHSLTHGGDQYMLLADYADYVACQERVNELFKQPHEWARKAVLNVAHMGRFSSDRTIREYAEKIWNIKPVHQD